jgi:hypothetical protein
MRLGLVPLALVAVVALAAAAFAAPAGAKTKTKTFANPTAVPIPDATPGVNFQPGAAFSDLAVTKKGTIKDVDVGVQVTHPDTGDLDLYLFKGETYIPLAFGESGGSSTANFGGGTACTGGITVFDSAAPLGIFYGNNPFAGSFKPALNALPLGVFNGEQLKGTWRLLVLDYDAPPPADVGTINCVQLTARYKSG